MYDSYLSSIATVQASIEKMNTILSNACKPSISVVQQNLTQSLLGFQQQISTITYPQFNFAVQMQAQLDALTAPVRQMQEILGASLDSGIRDSLAVNNSILEQTKILQESMSSLASAFHGIAIHESYVSVPEILIPDNYVYEETIPKSSDRPNESSKMAIPIKRLSYSDALTIIGILIQLLCWIISFIQTSQSSLQEQQNHQELVALQVESNRLQEESNRIQAERNQILQQQLDSTEKQVEYLLTIYSTIQESDSAPPDIDLCPQYDSSQFQTDESNLPTEADDSHNTNTPQQPD